MVPITEASVIIAVSSPHRTESLEAVMYCINTLKASVPIWKKVCMSGDKIKFRPMLVLDVWAALAALQAAAAPGVLSVLAPESFL